MSQVVTTPIDISERSGQTVSVPVAASTKLFIGTIGARDSSGNATFAQDIAGGLVVLGRIEEDADNSAGLAGDVDVRILRSVFKYKNSTRTAGAYALSKADVGDICYVEDEQTVQKASGSTYKVKAGIFLGLDPVDGGAWVDMRHSGDAGITLTQDSITDNSGGTPATPTAGAVTIAIINGGTTDTSAAKKTDTANAIATIIAELNKVKADLAAIKAAI